MDIPSWRIAPLTALVFTLLSGIPHTVAEAPDNTKATAAASLVQPSQSYEVQPGDTLWKIVQSFGIDLDQLHAFNPEVNLKKLSNGMRLRIPEKMVLTPAIQPVLAPQPQVIYSRAGEPMHFNRALSCTLTAYTAGPESTGKQPGDPAYGITFSGTKATEGRTVAVDPNIIPIGSKIYIEGIGLRTAEDTGGAIKGGRIDVFFEDLKTALEFGIQSGIKVFVLE